MSQPFATPFGQPAQTPAAAPVQQAAPPAQPFQQQAPAPAAQAAPAASPFAQAAQSAAPATAPAQQQAPAPAQQGGFAGGSFAGQTTAGATAAGAPAGDGVHAQPNKGFSLGFATDVERPQRPFRTRSQEEYTKLAMYPGQVVILDEIAPIMVPDKRSPVQGAKKQVGKGNLFVYFPDAVDPNTGAAGVWQPWPNQIFHNKEVINLIKTMHSNGYTTVAGVVRVFPDNDKACNLIELTPEQHAIVEAVMPQVQEVRQAFYESQFEPEGTAPQQ